MYTNIRDFVIYILYFIQFILNTYLNIINKYIGKKFCL